MPTTYKEILSAIEHMQPMMSVRGLSGKTQIMLMRLWGELCRHAAMVSEADAALIVEHGSVGRGGVINFIDDGHREAYLAEREDMLSAEVTVEPIRIRAEDALFAVSTPQTWAALEQFITIED